MPMMMMGSMLPRDQRRAELWVHIALQKQVIMDQYNTSREVRTRARLRC
jgi:hypothetical protein